MTTPPRPPAPRPVGGRGLRQRPRHRSGRPVLDPDVVAERALRVLTDAGVEAVTMSRVARELGVTVRAVYHWVPSRAALLEAAVLRAQESLPQPRRTGDWRSDLRRYRDELLEWLDTHPGILDVHLVEDIAAVGPRVLSAHEAGLALFADIGFAPRRARMLLAEFAKWVGATHHFHLRPQRAAAERAGLFERVVADTHTAAVPDAQPLTAAAGTTTLDEQLEDGFAWLLDSIEAALHRSDPDDPDPDDPDPDDPDPDSPAPDRPASG